MRRLLGWIRRGDRAAGLRAELQRNAALQQLASAVASTVGLGGPNAYEATDPLNQAMEGFRPVAGGANQLLLGSLPKLVAFGRHLVRNAPLGRAVRWAYQADIVGSGIGIEPKTGQDELDKALRQRWNRWAKQASVRGTSLWSLQRMGVGDLAGAGAALWRVLIDPDLLVAGVPVRVQALEVEWLSAQPVAEVPAGHTFHQGVEWDDLGVAVAYHLRQPGTFSGGEVVPDLAFGNGQGIIHAFPEDRALQAHGEPVLASCVERVLQSSELVRTELGAAKVAAALSVMLETESPLDADASNSSGTPTQRFPLGAIMSLFPGEKATVVKNERPSQGIGTFLDVIKGEIAAATGVSRRWLDRSMEGGNYSRDRMDQLLTQRVLGPLKTEMGHHLAGRVYAAVLPWMLQAERIAVPPPGSERMERLAGYELRPDQPPLLDLLKDGQGIAFMVSNNLMTLEEALAMRGKDIDTVLETRAAEVRRLREMGLPQTGAESNDWSDVPLPDMVPDESTEISNA